MDPWSRAWPLTAIAVLNFLFSFGTLIGGIDTVRYLHQPGSVVDSYGIHFVYPSYAWQVFFGLSQILRALLFVVVGIGLIRRSQRLGQRLGTFHAGASLVLFALSVYVNQTRGLSPLHGMACLYPLVMLYVLNVSHRREFVAP